MGEGDFERVTREGLERVADDPDARRRASLRFAQIPRHATFPSYASLQFDALGYLWIEEYRRPGEEQPAWQVFDSDGVVVARVETPAGLRVLEIGEAYVLGVADDEFGAERIRLYQLSRVEP